MTSEVMRKIEIATNTQEECLSIGTKIHEQLRGNQDYIDSNILLNCTEGDNVVRVYIFKECTTIPEIAI